MTPAALRALLEQVREGTLTPEQALERLRHFPFEDLEFARLDHHRGVRCGFPEVVFCPGKTGEQVAQIASRLVASGANVLATRVSGEHVEALRRVDERAEYHETARAVTIRQQRGDPPRGRVLIVAAGTGDLPVAEEARVTCEIMDQPVETVYDVGVAGLHRLLPEVGRLEAASVVIVVAGMEGALPSVVGGLVSVPVIAVPTSVGYGASFQGLAALLAMLNSCANGIAVVNIDNGFGAACLAARITRVGARAQERDG